MRSLLLICILLFWPVAALEACEPASFNFDLFLKENDKNKDGYLQKNELLAANENGDYGNYLEKPITTAEAFIALDTDKDTKLARDELWHWGQYAYNGCKNFDTAPKEKNTLGFFEKVITWFVNLFS
jgi:hypothetical protein